MSTLINAKLRHKRGTEASIPMLLDGQLYLCTDSHKLFKGTATGNVCIGDITLLGLKANEADATRTTANKTTVTGAINELNDKGAYNVIVSNTSAVSSASGATTAVPFDTNVIDPKTMHSTTVNNTRVNIVKSGTYLIVGYGMWSGYSTGYRELCIKINNATVIADIWSYPTGVQQGMQTVGIAKLNNNDYVELVCAQTSGVALSLLGGTPRLSLQRIGD